MQAIKDFPKKHLGALVINFLNLVILFFYLISNRLMVSSIAIVIDVFFLSCSIDALKKEKTFDTIVDVILCFIAAVVGAGILIYALLITFAKIGNLFG